MYKKARKKRTETETMGKKHSTTHRMAFFWLVSKKDQLKAKRKIFVIPGNTNILPLRENFPLKQDFPAKIKGFADGFHEFSRQNQAETEKKIGMNG